MRFIIWGDSKGKENGINKKILNCIMNRISKLEPKPKFMIMLGDTVKGSLNEEVFTHQLIDLNDIINKYIPEIKLLPVIGNHEANIIPKDDRFERIISNFYCNLNPTSSLKDYNNTVYFKDFDNLRIIILNSHHPNEIHQICVSQLSWLENITSDCSKKKLLFVHSPLFPTGAHIGHCLDQYPEKRNALLKTLENSNIDIVFCGHEHNYSRRIIKTNCDNNNNNGIYQIITGGAGEKLKDKYKSKNGVIIPPIAKFHFLLADYTKNKLEISAISINGKILDSFII
ncbi:calcineurin [Clostridium sp. SM-530-WT-3G]|nr:metallophosphoesterase [Clostridium sp. SM-530-WT-3G]NME84135.1 calcineurin [Clostridium sp. SM-530-WT-3G]